MVSASHLLLKLVGWQWLQQKLGGREVFWEVHHHIGSLLLVYDVEVAVQVFTAPLKIHDASDVVDLVRDAEVEIPQRNGLVLFLQLVTFAWLVQDLLRNNQAGLHIYMILISRSVCWPLN